MTAPASMTLPGGRAVLGWWHGLAGLAPRRLWFAHLLVHQIEALVEAAAPRPFAPLADALGAILERREGPISPKRLADELSAPVGLIQEVLLDLAAGGRVVQGAEGWRVAAGEARPPRRERRTFVFADGRPPAYLPLPSRWATPIGPPPGWRFELDTLTACVGQSAEWKQSHGFPPEVSRVIAPGSDWQSVAVDQPGQALLLFAEVPSHPAGVVAFGVRSPDWTLSAEPIFRLPADALTALGMDDGADAWRQAWQAWCQQRSLPASEVDACRLEPVGHRLVIRAPVGLIDRLRASKSDALKGEAWLLAGTGRVRPTAQVELAAG